MGKSKIDIHNKMTQEDLDKEISKYTKCYRYYQRLIAVKIVDGENTIADAARMLGKEYATDRWMKTCESEGLQGLKPNFGGWKILQIN